MSDKPEHPEESPTPEDDFFTEEGLKNLEKNGCSFEDIIADIKKALGNDRRE
jgi:hypothetical protein